MKHLIVAIAAAFAVGAYANTGHKKATTTTTTTTTEHTATEHGAAAPGKPTATAPATTHGDDTCAKAKDPKKCMEEQKHKSM